jgi:Mrp family chromosome partitioning ATPase
MRAKTKWPWDPKAPSDGAYREEFQRVALALSGSRNSDRTTGVLFSGCRSGDGASTAMLAVGREIQQMGLRPLLVEFNRRRPCFVERLGLDSTRTLPTLAGDSASLLESIQLDSSGMAILPCASDWVPDSIQKAACRVLQAAEGRYDRVLFDMPALLECADALAAAPVVDELVVVCRAGRTSGESLARIRQQADRSGLTILGMILTMQQRIVPGWLDRWLEG